MKFTNNHMPTMPLSLKLLKLILIKQQRCKEPFF